VFINLIGVHVYAVCKASPQASFIVGQQLNVRLRILFQRETDSSRGKDRKNP